MFLYFLYEFKLICNLKTFIFQVSKRKLSTARRALDGPMVCTVPLQQESPWFEIPMGRALSVLCHPVSACFPTLPYGAFGDRGTCEGWFVPCVSSAMRGARCCLKAAGIGSSYPALWLKGKLVEVG